MIRFLILAVLAYILYRLLFGGAKAARRQADPGRAGGSLPAQDVLVEDPVCHTYVPLGQAVSLKTGGRTEHFCSEACRAQFVAQQARKH
ncbi:MAG: TRASH domain protein [Thermodesulfobacteriota bacterium]